MASEESVTEQFQLIGIEIDQEVLRKCVSLCEEYGIDAESLSEQWIAFHVNHNSAPLTLDNLDLLARKEFSKLAASRDNATAKQTPQPAAGKGLTVYAAPVALQSDNDEVLSNYMSTTPKRIKRENDTNAVHNELRPATYSPSVGHSAKYSSRTNQGTVVHSFGDEDLVAELAKPNIDGASVNVTQVPNDDGELYTKSMFGFELLHEKASTFDNHIRYVSQCILKKHGLGDTVSVRHKTQNEVTVCGRIECDADARLNPKSVVLQGSWEESLSQAVPVDLDNVSQYSLFPGQVVVMRGVNPRGDRFVAREVYTDASQPVPPVNSTHKGKISLVVASGPYTTSDNLAYQPLKDLVSYISAHKPHVVIMTGPFIDCDHVKVKDNTMAETFKSFFEKLMDSLGELNTICPNTKIYVVSSLKDAFHVNIFPTPAYSTRRKHLNVQFVPDPSVLDVAGFVIGVTSTDVIMHLSQEEIALGVGGDKLSRLCSHLPAQQSLAPAWPSPLPADAALLAAHAQLPAAAPPQLLLLPSHFRYFVKEVNGCVMVNPEHLTKGAGGGTFARLLLDAGRAGVAAQVLRV